MAASASRFLSIASASAVSTSSTHVGSAAAPTLQPALFRKSRRENLINICPGSFESHNSPPFPEQNAERWLHSTPNLLFGLPAGENIHPVASNYVWCDVTVTCW